MIKHSDYGRYLDEFVSRLNKKEYYAAHESLEIIWFERRFEDNDEMRLLKGFINASVSFELIKRDREESSKNVWKNYLKYRPLLYKVTSTHINKYHQVARRIEEIYINYNKCSS